MTDNLARAMGFYFLSRIPLGDGWSPFIEFVHYGVSLAAVGSSIYYLWKWVRE